MKLSREQLKERAWYRAIKVLFIIGLLLAQSIGFLITYFSKEDLFDVIGSFILPFIIISIIFWVIARIFFYIVLGEPFFKNSKENDDYHKTLREFNEELNKNDKNITAEQINKDIKNTPFEKVYKIVHKEDDKNEK